MSSTSITLSISPRLARMLACTNVCETEDFNPMFKSDCLALEEWVRIKQRLRRETGGLDIDCFDSVTTRERRVARNVETAREEVSASAQGDHSS